MSNTLHIFGGSLYSAVKRVAGREGTRRGQPQNLRPQPPRIPASLSDCITGVISAVNGSGSAVTYSAYSEFNPAITVTNVVPEDRVHNPAIITVVPAPLMSRCWLARKKNAQGASVWTIARAWQEIWQTEACDAGGGAGAGVSGVLTVSEHSRDDRQLTYGSLTSQTGAVTAGAATRFGFKFYDFPAGYIVLHNLIVSLKASAPANVNSLLFSVGTALVTGTGTTLTGTAADVMRQTTLGTLAAAGVLYAGHSRDLPAGANGTATPIDLYLNFAPSANWTASENITISQPSASARAISFAWRNGGAL